MHSDPPSKKRRHGGKAGTHPAQQRCRLWRPCGSHTPAGRSRWPAGRTAHESREESYGKWHPYPPGSKRRGRVRCRGGPPLSAPVTVVVTPLECQSKPSTQPSAWNQNGSDKRRSNSSGPRSKTACVAISRASRVIRVKSPLGRDRDVTEGWRSRYDGPCKELRISAAAVCNDGPGFWIQSKVPDELSVNQASRVGLHGTDSRSR